MTRLISLGTYLPPWTHSGIRVAGPDEDAVTLGVEAGLGALHGADRNSVRTVVFVTREFPLLDGGNGAALLAGLDLPRSVPVIEVMGGAPQALDAVLAAEAGTLLIGVDGAAGAAGAGAALVGTSSATGVDILRTGGISRSLPVTTRAVDGTIVEYGDPRLQREMGLATSLSTLFSSQEISPPLVSVAGATRAQLKGIVDKPVPELPTRGASSPFFSLAAVIESRTPGTMLASEQANLTAGVVLPGSVPVARCEPQVQELPKTVTSTGNGIPISLAAYGRAFDSKLRWQAAKYPGGEQLTFPPRFELSNDGVLRTDYELVSLPRSGSIYTQTTVRIPVPDLPSPYSLVIVELDGMPDFRVLVKTTGTIPGSLEIGDHGRLVLRRVAVRSGVPDYGYAFAPDLDHEVTKANQSVNSGASS